MAAKPQPVADEGLFGGAPPAPPSADDVVTVSKTELQAMIAAAVMASQPATAAPTEFGGAKALFEQMALSIAEMTHQSNRTHKPVDPKVLSARKAGQDRLNALLERITIDRKEIEDQPWADAQEKQAALMSVTPRYRLISAVVLDDEFIAPVRQNPATKKSEPIAIYWAQEPNDAMIPLNDIAQDVHAAFRESRGARTEIEKRAVKPAWTTENGLYVEGRAPKRRELDRPGVIRDTLTQTPIAQGEKTYKNVLGTSHRPFETVMRPSASKFEAV